MSEAFQLDGRVTLVTGGARRIGAAIATSLHAAGSDIALHYRGSRSEAQALADALNNARANSAMAFHADVNDSGAPAGLVKAVTDWQGRLDVLVNNASSFYPTPLGQITEEDWADIVGSNLKAPLFLAQAAAPALKSAQGVIINIVDIHAHKPLGDHQVYSVAKAGLAMLTRSLARELAPQVRVNGIAPGAIIWPEQGMTEDVKKLILRQIPLAKTGTPEDIATAVVFLVRDAPYVTGQILAIDGGRSIGW